jgi:hypothetical protein
VAWWSRFPFEPVDDERVVVHLRRRERLLLATVVARARESLLSPADPTLQRLFPTAHPDDPARQAEWEEMARDRLLEARFAAFDVIEATVDDEELTVDQLMVWSQGLNAIRLLLGTALDVSEDLEEVDEDDPNVADYAVYDYLGYLVDGTVRALSTHLPPDGGA